MYVFLLCWWVAIIQPERSVILEVRILLESQVIAMLQVCSYLINSDNEHSHSKRCNNCSGTTFRPRRSSSGTKTVFVPDEDLRGRNVVPLQFLHLLLCECSLSLLII